MPVTDSPKGEDISSKVTFNNLLLAVLDEGPRDLYDGLHELYFGEEEVEIEGKIAKKREALEYLPPLLHIQLQVSSLGGSDAGAKT
jgi:hypothetical protein